MKTLSMKETSSFCMKEWTTKYGEVELSHQCYLNKGHDEDCVCYECEEMPIELHSYKGGDSK